MNLREGRDGRLHTRRLQGAEPERRHAQRGHHGPLGERVKKEQQ